MFSFMTRGYAVTESNIHLGTSGWSYNEREGPFYRKGEKRKLHAYSSVFKIVEIDSTFYRNPSQGTVSYGVAKIFSTRFHLYRQNAQNNNPR